VIPLATHLPIFRSFPDDLLEGWEAKGFTQVLPEVPAVPETQDLIHLIVPSIFIHGSCRKSRAEARNVKFILQTPGWQIQEVVKLCYKELQISK
jgi:hypothetical protein